MNYELKMHNIRIAWRNLMKYKVQNIIAVLCLAVGMVCFSLTYIFTQQGFTAAMKNGDSRRAIVELNTQADSTVWFDSNILKRIGNSHLKSLDFIDLNEHAVTTALEYISPEGKKYTAHTSVKWISPEHLNYLCLRSAITGKRIPVLKPGDIIMTKGMLESTFGKDVNPIGYKLVQEQISSPGKKVIVDVVDTGDLMLNENSLMIVTNLLQEYPGQDTNSYIRYIYVILKKGKTAQDLQKELEQVLPEYKVEVTASRSGLSIKSISGLLLFLLFGSSILLIGLFGFLKTQIQLFRLRQREIGLRQCMGAQREQLFSLMMWEIGIVFFFVTLLTLILTSITADFAIPIMQGEISTFTIDIARTYTTELWICLAVFLLTAGIAALSVRKVVTTPLNEVVGKSHRTSTRGHSLLIVLQMVICISLLNFMFFLFFFVDKDEAPANADEFRRCIITDNSEWKPEFLDEIPHLQHVAGSTHIVSAEFLQDLQNGEDPWDPRSKVTRADGSTYCLYEALLTDEHLFGLLNMELLPTDTKEMNYTKGIKPVYAPTERAAQLRKQFGLPLKGAPEYFTMEKGKQAEKIGYVQIAPFGELTFGKNYLYPHHIYICNTDFFLDKSSSIDSRAWENFENCPGYWSLLHHIIFKAKPGEYKAAMKELTGLYHEHCKYTQVKAPIDNMYDVCYKNLRTQELMLQVLYIMATVALLCIVLTLFSSVSLDTRGRQKEIAIRKAHGASAKQILWLFGRQYVWYIIISSVVCSILFVAFIYFAALREFEGKPAIEWFMIFLIPVLIITLITVLTVGYKIYKVSKLEPVSIIKKE